MKNFLYIFWATVTGVINVPLVLCQQLRLTEQNSFKVLQFADLHEGEGPDSWGPETDERTESFLSRAIDLEKPDLVVFSGDQITGLNVETNATDYYQRLSDLVDPTPHTMILGNHDAEPYSGNGDQSDPGALTTRSDLIAFDSSQPNSYTAVGPPELSPAISTYIVDVLSPSSSEVSLQIIHLDSGGGGMSEIILPNQVAWLESELEKRREKNGRPVPSIVFIHIPFSEIETSKENGSECFGVELDGVTPTDSDGGLFSLLSNYTEIKSVFSGHDHCNSFCCKLPTLSLCFGRHSSFGGYSCEKQAKEIGARVIDVQVKGEEVEINTWIRMYSGNVIEEHGL
ncbi:hypothetical protein TrST_g2848 [Triparma strigata]|uniref:Calcineurin-like phosphoesterase domain-containing protein n=1 Tax=Triparma strigata TaxID=1606541 RepID=A0A9W7EID5_9STRA|nr:hypothetical protein TrST_g2848 [Triparma strigata]